MGLKRYFIIASLLVFYINSFSQVCLPDWSYKRRIGITNPNAGALTDFQVKIEINTQDLVNAGKMCIDGRDIRFVTSTGTFLYYWIEDGTMNSINTKIWIKVDNLAASSVTSIYMFYGNNSAFNFSDGNKTFLFFDDFSGNLNDKWINTCSPSHAVLSNGKLVLSSTNTESAIVRCRNSYAYTSDATTLMKVYSRAGTAQAFLSVSNSADYGYGICCDGSTIDLRKITAEESCFKLYAPAGSYIYYYGGNYWSLNWITSSSQSGFVEGGSSSVTMVSNYADYTLPLKVSPAIGLGKGNASFEVDWILARKKAGNESFTFVFDAEQALPSTGSVEVSNNSPLCAGEDLQLVAKDIPGSSFSWTYNGITVTDRQLIKSGVTTNDNGVYTLEVSTTPPNPCPSYKAYYNVIVSPVSVGGTTLGSKHECYGSNSGTVSLTGSTGAVVRWEYSETGADPWYTISNTSTVQSYTNLSTSTSYRAVVKSGTCSEVISTQSDITIDQLPVAGTITGAQNTCKNGSVSLTLTGYSGTILYWQYSTDNVNWYNYTSNQTNVTFTGLTTTTWYKVVVGNGVCNTVTSLPVKVDVIQPTVAGSASDALICSGQSGNIQLGGYLGTILRWESSLSGSSGWTSITETSDNISYTNLTQTTYYRAVVKNDVCLTEFSLPAKIEVDQPVVSGFVTGSDTVCKGMNSGKLILKNYSGIISKWQRSSNGNTWVDFSFTNDTFIYTNLLNETHYKAVLSSFLGKCASQSSSSAYVAISNNTIAGNLTGAATVCQTSNTGTLKLENYTGNIVNWERSSTGNDSWTIVSNTTDSLKYTNLPESTWYRVLVKSGRCSALLSNIAAVKVDKPAKAGSLTGSKSVCAVNNEGTIILTGFQGTIEKWEQSTDLTKWTALTTAKNTEYTYKDLLQTTHYRVVVSNGVCDNDTTAIATITVFPLPKVSFAADTADVGKTTHFKNNSSTSVGNLYAFSWDFGNGYSSSSKNPSFTYTVSGVYSVKLVVTTDKNCTDSTRKNILVKAMPKPDFEISNVCYGSPVTITNKSVIVSGGMTSVWSLGDGATSNETSLSHTYQKSGIFTIKLIVISDAGSKDSISKQVEVYPRSNPDFSATSVCEGLSTSFTNKATLSNGSMNYLWSFGDNTTNMALNPEHTYSKFGNYIAKLRVTTDKGCADSISKTIVVHPLPVATFGATNVPYKDSSVFTDSSRVASGKITKWKWSFGDASSSQLQHVSHVYRTPGVYLVTLFVETEFECTDLGSKNIEVYDLPNASFSFSDVCEDDTVYFLNTSDITSGSLTYEWDFGDNTTSKEKSLSHFYKIPGRYLVSLIVTSDKNGKDTLYKTAEVFPKPDPDYEVAGVCKGMPSNFKNKSLISKGFVSSYTWDFSDGSNSIQTNPVKLFEEVKIYNVKLIAISDKNCVDEVIKTAEVYVLPRAGFEAQSVCLGSPVQFHNLSTIKTGELQYNWYFENRGTSNATHPDFIFDSPDTFMVKLVVNSEHHCLDSIEKEIIVRTPPMTDAGQDTSAIFGFPVTFNASGGVIYDWQPAEGLDNPGISNPIARPRQTTTYTVRVVDRFGCSNTDSVTISIKDEQLIIPSNVFTPNNDGVNDYWTITNIDFYEQANLNIYNRWGKLVYHKTNYLQNWDGKNANGDVLPDGTYYYVINFPNSSKYYSGAVTILRDK